MGFAPAILYNRKLHKAVYGCFPIAAAYTGKKSLIPPAAAVLPTVSSFSFKNSAESPLRRICTRKAPLFAAGGGKLTSPYMVPDVQAAFYGFGKRSGAFYNFIWGYSTVGRAPALEICILPVLEMDAFLDPFDPSPPFASGDTCEAGLARSCIFSHGPPKHLLSVFLEFFIFVWYI